MRNPLLTKISNFPIISTPFFASRKCAYYEWAKNIKNKYFRASRGFDSRPGEVNETSFHSINTQKSHHFKTMATKDHLSSLNRRGKFAL